MVDSYRDPIFNLAYRMTGSYEDADDLAQETFVLTYRRLQYFNPEKIIFPWLYTIGLNLIRNHLKNGDGSRRGRRRRRMPERTSRMNPGAWISS